MVSSDEDFVPSDQESPEEAIGRPRQRGRASSAARPPQRRRQNEAPAEQQPASQRPGRVAAAAAAAPQPAVAVAAASQRPAANVLPQDEQINAVAADLGINGRDTAARIDQLRQILRSQGILYLDDFSLHELARLAFMLVKSQRQRYRPANVQNEINQHYERNRNGVDAQLHDHELNEYATIMDYIIKVKASIFGIRRLIRENDPQIRITTMRDDETGEQTLDVWAFIPERLSYQICQGTAFQHFDDYRDFDGRDYTFTRARFFLGLFSGIVMDTDARLLHPNVIKGTVPTSCRGVPFGYGDGNFGPDGNWASITRRLHYTINPEGVWQVSLEGTVIKLHRLIHLVATQLEISIFNGVSFADIGLQIPPNATYDNYIAYHPPNGRSIQSIVRALRQGAAHSRRCDVDHRLGYAYAYCHALGHSQATSHRMNTCFIHSRCKAGHWCFGLLLAAYTDGETTPDEIDHSFVDLIGRNENGVATFDGVPIQDLNPFEVLTYVQDMWIVDVDCYCRRNGGEECHVCLCRCEEDDDELCRTCLAFARRNQRNQRNH